MYGRNEASDHALRQTRDNFKRYGNRKWQTPCHNQGKVRTDRTLQEDQPTTVLGGNDKNHTLFLRW